MVLIVVALVALVVIVFSDTASADGVGTGGTSTSAASVSAGWLPAGLVPAVAQVESGGKQYDANGNVITSSAGAIGIMQLMPGTAADLGVDPYDEAQNVAGGTAYLNQLYARFGDLADTLAAYNWGPGNVSQALANGQPFPTSVQGYIAKVLAALGGQS